MKECYAAPLEEFFCKRKIKSITYGDLNEFCAAREAVPKKGTYEPHLTASLQKIEDPLQLVIVQRIAQPFHYDRRVAPHLIIALPSQGR
jgi:hypothetical protein